MSEIKLEKSPTADIGKTPDIDENNKSFNRLTLNVTHPVTKDNWYMEYSKQDSESLLVEKENEVYVEEDNIKYLKNLWEADEYSFFLESSTLVQASEGLSLIHI